MKVKINSQGHMTKMAAMAINSKNLKNLLIQNQTAYDFETWLKASKLYKVYIYHDRGMTLTYLMTRST